MRLISVKTQASRNAYSAATVVSPARGIMEVPMAMHHDHVTDTEDVAFDATMKIGGIVVALVLIAVAASWYFAG